MLCQNHFQILPPAAVSLQGELGKAAHLCRENFLKRVNWRGLVQPFRDRPETTTWRSEFWGKMIRGAILMAYVTQDQELKETIRDSVYDILSTQDANGCISTVAPEKQPGSWDMWGRKYVLMGLTRYCQYLDRDPKVIQACARMTDHIISQIGPGAPASPVAVGCHNGLATCSMLGAIVRVYRLTQDPRHLEFAKFIARTGCSTDGDIFQGVLEGKTPAELGNGKAYEMTSCFQGLGELCLETDDFPQTLQVLTQYYHGVRDREILCTGVGGGKDTWGEFWYDMALRQNIKDPKATGAMGETCITVTWLHYLERMLQLTGDARVFDQCELAFYNALLGAMTIDGTNFTHRNPTPLAGGAYKIAAPDQMLLGFNRPFHGMDCCRAQGPEGLALAPMLAVMVQDGAPVFNLYEDMEVRLQGVTYTVTGGWPFAGDRVKIALSMDAPRKMTLRFRVPERDSGTDFLQVNGQAVPTRPGEYAAVEREWKNADQVELHFDQALRKRFLPTTPNTFCYMKGPVVLAEDGRLNSYHGDTGSYRIAIPMEEGKYLCDYASAGAEFLEVHRLQVVFP